ncbi:MAG: hypothetical protein ACSHX8_01550 [Opitutaceae bacterium]
MTNRLTIYMSFVLLLTCVTNVWGDSSLPFRLRGVMVAGDSMLFSIHSAENGSPGWLRIGRSYYGYELVEFDESAMTLRLQYGEESFYLKLSESSEFSDATVVGSTIEDGYAGSEYSSSATTTPVAHHSAGLKGPRDGVVRSVLNSRSVALSHVVEGNTWKIHDDSRSISEGEVKQIAQADLDEPSIVRRRTHRVKKVPRPSQFIIIEN